jgi:glycosyltransferase involved in cell wall biosynthesis
MHDKDRLKILFFPAWYPSEVNPVEGVFVREHAHAASLDNDIVVLYACPDHAPQPKGIKRVSEDIEEGIRTIRVRYGGIILYLWKKLTGREGRQQISSESKTKGNIGGKVISIPLILANAVLYYWSVFSTFHRLRKEGWKPDIIHAHVYSAGLTAIILGKLYKVPVIITEHYSGIITHKLPFLERIKLRFAMNRAKIILPVSDVLGGALKEYYGVKTKIFIVPNTVNIIRFSSSIKLETMHPEKKILSVCNLIPRKGVNYLLQALSQIKEKRQDFSLDIVGDGTHRHEYEMLAKDLGLDRMTTFYGRRTDMDKFMRECDFFVLPSLYESFGVVYIEAMASGKPVIATDAGGQIEIVNEEVGILIPPGNVPALIEAIEYMMNNHQNYSADIIRKYTIEKYSYEAVGHALDDVYKKIRSL